MTPTLASGDTVFVNLSAYKKSPPNIGDIVLAHHPYQRDLKIIKRVADITSDERYVLHSDNRREGTDSRSFGTLGANRIIGKVTSCSKAQSR